MDLNALFKISHGVYITGAVEENGRLVGSCIDAVMVAEVSPAQILVSLGKQSYTQETVVKTKRLALSVLPQTVTDDLIGRFGMQSSRTTDKWVETDYRLMGGLPVLNQAVAVMTLDVKAVWETETHRVFLCQVNEIETGIPEKPLIYQEYQDRKRKENKMAETKKWVCTICGYVYDGEVPFEELPEDWVCPLCGEPKSVFVRE